MQDHTPSQPDDDSHAAMTPLRDELRLQLMGTVLDAVPGLVVVYKLADLKVVYLNKAAATRLNPENANEVGTLGLEDFTSLSSLQSLQGEILPRAQVLGRWAGEFEMRDGWGSEFRTMAVFTVHSNRRRETSADYLCMHAQEQANTVAADRTHFTDRHLLHALLNHSNDCIYFKDSFSRFLRVSFAQAKKFGLSPTDVIGKTDFDIFTTPHASAAFIDENRVMKSGEPVLDLEEMETFEDGRVTWCSTSKFPLRDENNRIIGTFGVSRDITARKLAEKAHGEMEAQLQLAQKLESIGRLAAGVAHEINTPTQFIADNARFLTDAFGKIEAVLAKFHELGTAAAETPACAAALQAATAMEQEVELEYLSKEIPSCLKQSLDGLARVARIVQSLKEFAHPNSPDLTPSDLNRAIETSVMVSRHEWKYVAEVVTEFAPDLPLVPCMVDELNQVMLNLIVNAAHAIGDALKQRGGTSGKITVRTRLEVPWAIVEVEDTGTGISEEIRNRIFEPFFTTKSVGKGTGQGLAIVHTVVVKHHHGTVEVESELGRGTKFILRLPLATPESPEPDSPPLLQSPST